MAAKKFLPRAIAALLLFCAMISERKRLRSKTLLE